MGSIRNQIIHPITETIKMKEYYKDGKHYIDARPDGVEFMCDFCGELNPQPYKDYEAKDIEVMQAWESSTNQSHMSEGGWVACKQCAELIDKNDREGLIKRTIPIIMKKLGIPESRSVETEIEVRQIHRKFWESRT